MIKSGNGEPKRCVENLTCIVRGEVPFDRVRGIDARIIDKPVEQAAQELEQEALWNVETYEPRVNAETATITANLDDNGGFAIDIEVSDAAGDEDE